ncbi:hypothetical protein ACQ4PT_018817 [Festuca glaucescens]
MGGGSGDLSPTSIPTSPSSSSEPLPPAFADYVSVSSPSDGGSDGCSVCDDPEVEALLYGNRLQVHVRSLREAKELIRRYKPGYWIEGVGGTEAGDYVLPDITALLLVGPRGAGKSTLVNRITRVFDKDDGHFSPDRAQVCYNSKSNGTCFIQEYKIPRHSNDDKPAVVVTHGDRLSFQQRSYVQNELADTLAIPLQQIFDIPGSDDYETEMAVLDMLHYCVQHAEQNFPMKLIYLLEV